MKSKFIFVLMLSLSFFSSMEADEKSDPIKPHWVTHALPNSKSDTYIFERVYSEGKTLEEARKQSLRNLSLRIEKEHNLQINTQSEVCRVIDEYWSNKNGTYHMYILYTIPRYMLPGYSKLGNSYDDVIKTTTNYGTRGALSIIPGLGQFYKGNTGKGIMFLSLEAVSISGIILCENNRVAYRNKIIEQPKHAKEYKSRSDNWKTGRNICIGVAGAIYVWNLVDAFAAKGARRVIVKKHDRSLSVNPMATFDGGGLSVNYNF